MKFPGGLNIQQMMKQAQVMHFVGFIPVARQVGRLQVRRL